MKLQKAWVAFLLLPVATACSNACTTIGAETGINIKFAGTAAESVHAVHGCLGAQCFDGSETGPVTWFIPFPALAGQDTARISAFDASGKTLVNSDQPIAAAPVFPNGTDCPASGEQAAVTIALPTGASTSTPTSS